MAEWGMHELGRRRTARVYTNETCNQNCAFCDRRAPRERASFARADAVRARIDEAAAGASTIVLTGGEPTLRPDLPALIAYAKERAARVELETNAALIDGARALGLARAGLDLARVHLPAWGDACDAITRDAGGFEAALAGARSLAGANVALEIASPVVRANAASLASLPRALAESGLPIEALVIGVPSAAPDAGTLLPHDEAAAIVEAVEAAARIVGLSLRVDPHTVVLPCLFEHPARVAHLFALTPGGRTRAGHAQVAACARCRVADRCPGPAVAHADALADRLQPIESDRVRRRLSVISTVSEQIARELYQDEVTRVPGEPARLARTVRIDFRCNQACSFCFVSTHLPAPPLEAVRAAIVEAARRGGSIAISGGEPTLSDALLDHVRLARAEGASFVELQTNAVRLDGDPALARALREAGVALAHVSLHASHATLSDAITGAPGTFERTVRGIDELHRAGHALRIGFVFHRANIEDFPAFVELVAARWAEAEINVSFVAASTDVVPRTVALVPRYGDVVPWLARGMERAGELGVRVSGLASMCGIPLCLVPEDLASYFELATAPGDYAGGETVFAEACDACDLRGKCLGVRRGYVELHGSEELRPLRRGEAGAGAD